MTDHQWYILGFIHRMHAQICGKMRKTLTVMPTMTPIKFIMKVPFQLSLFLNWIGSSVYKMKTDPFLFPSSSTSSSFSFSFFRLIVDFCLLLFVWEGCVKRRRGCNLHILWTMNFLHRQPACLNIIARDLFIYWFVA